MGLSVGDIVRVNKDDIAMTLIDRAEILHTPAGEGDTWGFKDTATGREIHTNERITIYKLEATNEEFISEESKHGQE